MLPANEAAERSIIGAITLAPSLLDACTKFGLRADDFSLSANREIFTTLVRMAEANKPIDSLLLCDELDVKRIGGAAYLADLTTDAIPVESHVVARCRIVRRTARLRRILSIAEQMKEEARKQGADPEQIAAKAIAELKAVAE